MRASQIISRVSPKPTTAPDDQGDLEAEFEDPDGNKFPLRS